MRKEETPRPLVVVHCVSSHRTQSGNENAVFAARDAQRAVFGPSRSLIIFLKILLKRVNAHLAHIDAAT
jgi:hypothetical protein